VRLLLVEDAPRLRTTLLPWLTARGWSVDDAADGTTALSFLARYDYQLVLLDLGLPDLDGLEVLRRLRAGGKGARVLVLSARDQVGDRVQALELGADDYLVKPVSLDELDARLKALMRRQLEQPAPCLAVGALELEPARRLARVDGVVLALTPKEFALLEALCAARGTVLSRTTLFERIYDSRSEASDKVIEVLLSNLRTKLARAGVSGLIETRRGFGYCIP